ncbi:MAG: hypothetical protein CL674_01885 [Bdellovibrionaceae bacterium]|nr:hypothetical protein [Pseudobdellovibrionaceae bacterium]
MEINFMKNFIFCFLIFIGLDLIWFQVFMKSFATEQLGFHLQTSPDGSLQANVLAAVLAYLCMTVLFHFFMAPTIKELSTQKALLSAAIFGLMIFGVFDLTNLALLKSYPIKFVVVDMLWGFFLFPSTYYILKLIGTKS